jgi:hypothetical protein
MSTLSDEELAGDDGKSDECYFPSMHPEEAKRHLVVFENAMGRSQDSQQQIHGRGTRRWASTIPQQNNAAILPLKEATAGNSHKGHQTPYRL